MVAQKTVKDIEIQLYSLAVQPVFWDTLQEILDFTLNNWGAKFKKKSVILAVLSGSREATKVAGYHRNAGRVSPKSAHK